jgi:hypothetical protein
LVFETEQKGEDFGGGDGGGDGDGGDGMIVLLV